MALLAKFYCAPRALEKGGKGEKSPKRGDGQRASVFLLVKSRSSAVNCTLI